MCEERFSRKHMAKIFNWKIFVSLVGLVSFFSFFYQAILLLNHSAKHIPISSSLFRNKSLLGKRHDDNNFVACKLPELDPFHPSVIHFTKDFGKLRCNGASYSSFENNVLRVEGTGVVSVQYKGLWGTILEWFFLIQSEFATRKSVIKQVSVFRSQNSTIVLNFLVFFSYSARGVRGTYCEDTTQKFSPRLSFLSFSKLFKAF